MVVTYMYNVCSTETAQRLILYPQSNPLTTQQFVNKADQFNPNVTSIIRAKIVMKVRTRSQFSLLVPQLVATWPEDMLFFAFLANFIKSRINIIGCHSHLSLEMRGKMHLNQFSKDCPLMPKGLGWHLKVAFTQELYNCNAFCNCLTFCPVWCSHMTANNTSSCGRQKGPSLEDSVE